MFVVPTLCLFVLWWVLIFFKLREQRHTDVIRGVVVVAAKLHLTEGRRTFWVWVEENPKCRTSADKWDAEIFHELYIFTFKDWETTTKQADILERCVQIPKTDRGACLETTGTRRQDSNLTKKISYPVIQPIVQTLLIGKITLTQL